MRSRFSAFAKGLVDYLVATRLPSARAPKEALDLGRTISGTEWLDLRIVEVRAGSALDSEGEVEFIASYRDRATAAPGELHERSRFRRQDGRWYYVDGRPGIGSSKRPSGRNDPCWCGSGKKLKKCHGNFRENL